MAAMAKNPNQVYTSTLQFQVILKPAPVDVQDLYLKSLAAINVQLKEHDIRFEEDNWESPHTRRAWGIGWRVLLDGLEITQFTYFQQSGGLDLDPISVEANVRAIYANLRLPPERRERLRPALVLR